MAAEVHESMSHRLISLQIALHMPWEESEKGAIVFNPRRSILNVFTKKIRPYVSLTLQGETHLRTQEA